MSVKLGGKIAEGGCAEVFEWGEGKIVKLAKPNTNETAIQAEWRHSRIAKECGLPVPDTFDLVELDGRPGIVFEHIEGESLIKRFVGRGTTALQSGFDQPTSEFDDHLGAQVTANLLFQVHQHSVSNMPSQRENITYDIRRTSYLTEAEQTVIIHHMEQLPRKQQLCHGDPNPGNILLRELLEPVLIDWNNASIGNPEADLAEYILMIQFAILPSYLPKELNKVLDTMREATIQAFIAEYERLSGIGYHDIEPWLVVIAARKLSADGISEDEKSLLMKEIRRRLADLEGS
ncbi:phosphotransferase family protein [Paenibacillus paeoniae]|uniref:Aminoglycoside phosphotransferase n=1 Tax=Paenibacillus paeoniae TaxID=2292705 RepID=A0A371PKV3_9BACL|nr:aminoglycoside phosphotransferase family protein [Paenibacillus paeoniae]REK76818.1 aminoglycoside phosphotransferase [Paenibacillus paeoniae]